MPEQLDYILFVQQSFAWSKLVMIAFALFFAFVVGRFPADFHPGSMLSDSRSSPAKSAFERDGRDLARQDVGSISKSTVSHCDAFGSPMRLQFVQLRPICRQPNQLQLDEFSLPT